MTGDDRDYPGGKRQLWVRRLFRVLREQGQAVHLRLRVPLLLARLLPSNMCGEVRTVLLRLTGAQVGGRTLIFGAIELHGLCPSGRRLRIGRGVQIGPHCSIDLSAEVRIEDGVAIGHHVVIITADHQIAGPTQRCGPVVPRPVVIERGAWVGARVTVLPGVTVGAGSVIGAGSVVYHNVAPNTLVAGSPARAIRRLEEPPGAAEGTARVQRGNHGDTSADRGTGTGVYPAELRHG